MYQVLLVDDEIKITQWLRRTIHWEKMGFVVCSVCTGGLSALNYLERCRVDVVITDIRMPGLNGLELLKQLYECKPSIRTIILSGYNQFEYAQKAIKYGVKGFLLKPVDPEELTELLLEIKKELSPDSGSNAFSCKARLLPSSPQQGEHKIQSVMEYVDKNYNQDICLKNCADLFGFHPAYLGKIFKEAAGVSFSTYLNTKRISQLKKLLSQSSLPVSQLLESVGYYNYDYFSTIFKKYEGISFSEYRSRLSADTKMPP